MYFIVSLFAAITFTCLWAFLKIKKPLHFEYGALIFAGASIAWMVECIKFYMEGDGFIRFDQLWIDTVLGLITILFGLVIYCLAVFVPMALKKYKERKNK